MTEHLTTETYWDAFYRQRGGVEPVDLGSWRRVPERRIFEIKKRYGIDRGRVLELGGGFSPWLPLFCQRYPEARYACLDFAQTGVEALRAWQAENKVANLEVHHGDFFDASALHGQFDVVFSHGVVEHFRDLPAVLAAHGAFRRPNGVLITFIPNMGGVPGWLAKRLNREVYDTHVPHDLASFRQGHLGAGLTPIESGYLCAMHFGVLSNCMTAQPGLANALKTVVYKGLVAASLLTWRLEALGVRLPTSRAFSPYIYAVAYRRGPTDTGGPPAARRAAG